MENETRKIKKYETARGNLNTYVSIGDKTVRIRFVSRNNKEGYFITSDELLQNALENDKDYGIKYMLASEIEEDSEKSMTECTEVTSVNTWQQAKEFLHSQPYGIPLRSLTTPEKIKRAAQSNGLIFPNIVE